MAKIKKKLTPAQKNARKAAKAERKKKYETVFINGKQVKVKRRANEAPIEGNRNAHCSVYRKFYVNV